MGFVALHLAACGYVLWRNYHGKPPAVAHIIVRLLNLLNMVAPFLLLPMLSTITTVLNCDVLSNFVEADFVCRSGSHFLMIGATVAACVGWIPLMLYVEMLVFESDANSPNVLAASSGRHRFNWALARIVAAVAPMIASHLTILWILFIGFFLASTTVMLAQAAPYYHTHINKFFCGGVVLCGWIAVGTLATEAGEGARNDAFTTTWLILSVFVYAGGVALPLLKMRSMNARLQGLRGQMLAALDRFHGEHGGAVFNATSSAALSTLDLNATQTMQRVVESSRRMRGTLAGKNPVSRKRRRKKRDRRGSILAFTKKVEEARFLETRMPLADEALNGANDDPDSVPVSKAMRALLSEGAPVTPLDGFAPYEVGLLVRAELSLPENISKRGRAQGCFFTSGGIVPTSQAVEHALWLFAQAIEEFCDDPVDLGLIKLEYARFLRSYTADDNLATNAMIAVERDAPGLEARYATMCALHDLASQRDDGNARHATAAAEYAENLTSTMEMHEKVLKQRAGLFRAMLRRVGTISVDDQQLANRLGSMIDAMTKQTNKTNAAYRRLLFTNPNGTRLGELYGSFCQAVLNDEALASQHLVTDDGASAGGSSHAGTLVMNARHGMGKVTVMRALVPRPRTNQVRQLDQRLRGGMLLLAFLSGCMLLTSSYILGDIKDQVTYLGQAGTMRWAAVDAAVRARMLALNTSQAQIDGGHLTLNAWKSNMLEVFDKTHERDRASVFWFTADMSMRTFRPDGVPYSEVWNLWDSMNRMVADFGAVLEAAVTGTLQGNFGLVEWRFLVDNIVQVLPSLNKLSMSLEADVFDRDALCP